MEPKLKIPCVMLKRVDSWSILMGMLEHTKQPCSIVVCSFAIAEGWIKRLHKLKLSGKVERINVVLDYAVMIRHREKILMLENVVDKIYLDNTHAKMILVENETFQAAAVLSANATMNYRVESVYITNRNDEIETIKQDLEKIYDNSNSIRTGP